MGHLLRDQPFPKVALVCLYILKVGYLCRARAEVSFSDSQGQTDARRAAWYSAATVLQRAIALELDVDSMDVEIATVHSVIDGGNDDDASGEMYLADSHPNGSGLVKWAAANWKDLLIGCLTGSGDFGGMGRRLREQAVRMVREPWSSPNLLLQGFRNRQLHGLLEWQLGLDLLATMLDPDFIPGLSQAVLKAPFISEGMEQWTATAACGARSYARAFDSSCRLLPAEGWISGWITEKEPRSSRRHPTCIQFRNLHAITLALVICREDSLI